MTRRLENPVQDPQQPDLLWESRFLMSARDDRNPFMSIPDIRSVELHPSGLWAVVDLGDTTSWIRIPPHVDTVEFQHRYRAHYVSLNDAFAGGTPS